MNYTYDGDGLRVEKSSGTLYWRSFAGQVIEETNSGGTMTTDYIFFAGRRIAWKNGSGSVYYSFADALGSTRTATRSTRCARSGQADSSGPPSRMAGFNTDYYPYGQEKDYTTTCSPTYKFTGYEYDSETQNYYAYAREYDPRIARFLSADPLGEFWKYRMGDYRFICKIEDDRLVVLVLRVGHRREVHPTPPPKSGHFTCQFDRTFHVLTTPRRPSPFHPFQFLLRSRAASVRRPRLPRSPAFDSPTRFSCRFSVQFVPL